MTVWKNGFEGQTNGTAATTVNSAASGSAFTADTLNGGTINYSTAWAATGNTSILITPSGTSNCYFDVSAFNNVELSVSFCFDYAVTATAAMTLWQARTAVSAAFSINISPSGRLQMIDSTGTAMAGGSATNALVTGNTYRVEMQGLSDASAGTAALQYYLNNTGSAVQSLSVSGQNTRGGSITSMRFGRPSASGNWTAYAYDNIVAQDASLVPLGAYPGNLSPTANAGHDQSGIEPWAIVTLDGTDSSDPGGNTLTYAWVQIAGPNVSLSSSTAVQPTFVAPPQPITTTITFQLVVANGAGSSAPATVSITVAAHTTWTIQSGTANQPVRVSEIIR